MAIKMDTILVIGAIILVATMFNKPAETQIINQPGGGGSGTIDICPLVDGSVQFLGNRMFAEATALTAAEGVRILKENGGLVDLGTKGLNGATISTAPNKVYRLYYGQNISSTTANGYYTHKELYTAPCQKAVDQKVTSLCMWDTAPTFTVYNEDGDVQTSTTNAQAFTADDERTVKIKMKVATDKCYGNPELGLQNAICFKYPTSSILSVKANTGSSNIPYVIAANKSEASRAISCYNLPLLKDDGAGAGQVIIPVTIHTTSAYTTDAVTNITVWTDDVNYDLNADTLQEITGFEDEDNNDLGMSVLFNTTIYIKQS